MVILNKKLLLTTAALALLVGGVLPGVANAAPTKCPDYSGKVVRVKNDYWFVQDGQRVRLLDSGVAATWDKPVVTPRKGCIDGLPENGTLAFRAGSRLVKKTGTNTVYAVGNGGVLHAISTVDAAVQWYGRNWSRLVKNVPAAIFDKFTIGDPITVDRFHDGAVVRLAGKAQLYVIREGQLVKITGRVRPAISNHARTLSAAAFAKLPLSTQTVPATDLLKISTTPLAAADTAKTPENKPDSKKEAEPKAESKPSESNKAGEELSGANYTGPFPAPEGMVLEGTIGSVKYFEPTGSGVYRFAPKIDGTRSINCLDSTRTVYRSKGKNYDAGFKEGIFYGIKDGDVFFPKYNDTPRGSGNVGNQYYNEGFRVGYKHGYEVGNDYGTTYDCRTTAYKPGDYDADGWSKTTGFANAKNLTAVYFPGMAGGFAGVGKTSPQAYAWAMNTETVGMRIEDTELNKNKPVVNLSRIEIMESVPEGAEVSMTMEQVAKMSYDAAVQYTNTKYNRICVLTEPTIESKTYGGNTFALLTYIQVCKPEANKEATWKLQAYAFAKGKTSGNVFATTFINPFNLKKAGVDELDSSRIPSSEFIAQFLTKLQFN